MANLPASKKMIRVNARRRKNNKIWRQKVKNIVKSLRTKIDEGQDITKDEITELFKTVDKAAKKRVIHPNKANRLKSKISKAANFNG